MEIFKVKRNKKQNRDNTVVSVQCHLATLYRDKMSVALNANLFACACVCECIYVLNRGFFSFWWSSGCGGRGALEDELLPICWTERGKWEGKKLFLTSNLFSNLRCVEPYCAVL